MPETRLTSAVTPETGASMKAAGDANLQQQALNNQAMVARQRAQMEQQALQQQAALTREGMQKDVALAELQAKNYAALNTKDLVIAKMNDDARTAALQQNAQQFEESNRLKMQIHNSTMEAQKALDVFKVEMALADKYTDPDSQAKLEEMNKGLMDRVIAMEHAKEIMAGKESDATKIRDRVARGIRETADSMNPLIEKGMTAIAPDMTFADFKSSNVISRTFGEDIAGAIDTISESVLEVGTLQFGDFASGRDEGRLDIVSDPNTATKIATSYVSKTLKKALEAAFPQANVGQIMSTFEAQLRMSTPEGAARMAPQILKAFADNGVNPLVAGEMMSRMAESFERRSLALASEQGIRSNQSRSDITEDQVIGLTQAKILAALGNFKALAASMPQMSPYESWAATVSGGDVNEVEMALEQMVRGGYGGTANMQSVLEALQQVEDLRAQSVRDETAFGLEEERIGAESRRMGMDQERARVERMLQALENYRQ